MTAGSILLGIALLIAVGLYLAYPFWGASQRGRQERKNQRDWLVEQKDALLAQIQALDFDHETGKIPTEVHAFQRTRLMAEATEVLKQLDSLTGGVSDEAIEAAIARARSAQAPQTKAAAAPRAAVDEEMEQAIARARQQKTAVNGRTNFCPQCGTRVSGADKFCAACGHKLTPVTATS
ncbi:MAG: zinc ribbon domain-containing protein [Chloroflexota bacterium]